MTEQGFVEKPILEWLAGKPTDPNDHGLGWIYRSPQQMATYGRDATDPLVEPILISSLMRINTAVNTEQQARKVVSVFRQIISKPDLLDANRNTLEALADGIPVILNPGEDATTVKLIEFDLDKQELNDFTVTNQYEVKGAKTVKADTVLLLNGIPVVVCEYKSMVSSGHDWVEGVKQIHRYQRQAPALLVPNVFSVAADENDFRYGAVAFMVESDQDIEAQLEYWRPWLSLYPTKRLYWTLADNERDPDSVRAATHGLLRPRNVLDFIENFVVFATFEGKTKKKVARYQQFEAANDIVNRVVEGEHKTGLIWHTQGSGKSLTMIFAGYKLRRQIALDNPTVYIVVDRTDLKTQVADEFESCDYPNVVKAMGISDLKDKIRTGKRETIITTIQCFQNMDDLEPCRRDNVILLVDEAHRSQKGGSGLRGGGNEVAGFAMTMLAKLPKAFRFGLTGTPIDRTMVNTHRLFGPVIEGEQERYLSYYGIKQSIIDGATKEVHYIPSYIPVEVDEEPLNVSFEQMCAEMEVEDEEEKELLQRKEARWKALVKDDRRINKVISHMLQHFLDHPDPDGFKAQLVTVDREACGKYKAELDRQLRERGLPPEWSDVVISDKQNDLPELEPFHYSKETTEDIIARFKLTPEQFEDRCKERHGSDRRKWESPLKILIVCDKLLTGFDAPVEQVMYLDKPLRDHNLLQAMARTNRPLPEMGKRNGLIVDYFGVFNDVEKALNFDESIREEAVIDWDKLRAQFPIEIGLCMGFFNGIPMRDTRECLMACLQRLLDTETALRFETQFKRMEVLWEALSPDESLYDYRREYAWLCGIYIAHRRRNRRSAMSHMALAAKTRELIQLHTEFMDIAENLPIYKIDENYLVRVREIPSPQDRAAELQKALERELVEGDGGFLYKMLGERLKQAVERKEAGDEAALRFLTEMEAIVEQINESKREPERLGLTGRGEYRLYQVIWEFAAEKDEDLCVRAARAMMDQLRKKQLLPNGWGGNVGGRQNVSLTLQVTSWDGELKPLNLCPVGQSDPPFLQAAVEQLAKVYE